MSQDSTNILMQKRFSKEVCKLRLNVRRSGSVILKGILRRGGYPARRLSVHNVYYLDYDTYEREYAWTGFSPKDRKDRAHLKVICSFLESGGGPPYREMKYDDLPTAPNFLRWSFDNCSHLQRCGYVRNTLASTSVNAELDRQLRYQSCLHIPLASRKGAQPIGDIIVAFEDTDQLQMGTDPRTKRHRRALLEDIWKELYRQCDLSRACAEIGKEKRSGRPFLRKPQREFRYFFDRQLRSKYREAVEHLQEYIDEGDCVVSAFLCRVNNVLNGVKQALLLWDEAIRPLFEAATPLAKWVGLLKGGEEFAALLTKQREHWRHMMSVFMLGVVTLSERSFRKFVLSQMNQNLAKRAGGGSKVAPKIDEAALLAMWAVIAFSHDALQLPGLVKSVDDAIVKKFMGVDAKAASAGKGLGRLGDALCRKGWLGSAGAIAVHLSEARPDGRKRRKVEEGLRTCALCKNLNFLYGRLEEHDVLAGVLLCPALICGYRSMVQKDLWSWLVGEKLKGVQRTYCRDSIVTAVALHDCCTDTKEEGMPEILFEENPLLVLLAVCDGMHEWGRKFGRMRNLIEFLGIECRGKVLSLKVRLNCRGGRARQVVEGYQKHLREGFRRNVGTCSGWRVQLGLHNVAGGRTKTLTILG